MKEPWPGFEYNFKHFKGYGEVSIPTINLEVALCIYFEMERCEPFQGKSIYDDDRARYDFVLAVFKEAKKRYPITMKRAEIKYFGA